MQNETTTQKICPGCFLRGLRDVLSRRLPKSYFTEGIVKTYKGELCLVYACGDVRVFVREGKVEIEYETFLHVDKDGKLNRIPFESKVPLHNPLDAAGRIQEHFNQKTLNAYYSIQ